MFCDLVGSTALSQVLDAEDLREVLQGFQDAVTAAIREAGGFVAKFMGDGVLVYFGYPQASEDAARRAVQASLRIISAVEALPSIKGHALATRIGIATGPVVVGDVIGEDIAREVNVVGETPNLAARLQAVAAPNSAVIGDVTARIVAGIFSLRDLGQLTLKGMTQPMRAFAVVREHTAKEREAAAEATGEALLVGRDVELTLLLERWAQSKIGQGQMVLVSGEGGIGKSQLVDALRTRVLREGSFCITFRCSPYQQSSALSSCDCPPGTAASVQPRRRAGGEVHQAGAARPHVSLLESRYGDPLCPPAFNRTSGAREALASDTRATEATHTARRRGRYDGGCRAAAVACDLGGCPLDRSFIARAVELAARPDPDCPDTHGRDVSPRVSVTLGEPVAHDPDFSRELRPRARGGDSDARGRRQVAARCTDRANLGEN